MKRTILFFASIVGIVTCAFAQEKSVRIESPRLEFAVYNGSQKGMRFHFKLNISGYKGKKMSAIVFVYSPKGVGLKDKNGKYCNTSGDICFPCDFSPNYDNTVFNDFVIFIPYDELHMMEGYHEYYCRVYIFEEGKSWITHSDYVPFVCDLPPQQQQQSNRAAYDHLLPAIGELPNNTQDVCYKNSANHIASVRTYIVTSSSLSRGYSGATVSVYKGGGAGTGRIIYYEITSNRGGFWHGREVDMFGRVQPNGSTLRVANDWMHIQINNDIYNQPISKEKFDSMQPRSTVRGGGYGNGYGGSNSSSGDNYQYGPSHIDKPCGYCGGGGGCNSCKGTGSKYNPYGGYYSNCPSCNGSGRCFNCRGTGKQATY